MNQILDTSWYNKVKASDKKELLTEFNDRISHFSKVFHSLNSQDTIDVNEGIYVLNVGNLPLCSEGGQNMGGFRSLQVDS